MKTCPVCKAVSSEYSAHCYKCGRSFEMPKLEPLDQPPQTSSVLQSESKPESGSPEPKIPFEEWRTRGFWNSLLETWIQASLHPREFYPLAGKTKDIMSALLFYLIWQILGAFLGLILSIISPNPVIHSMMEKFGGTGSSHALFIIPFQIVSILIFYPVILLIGLFLWSAVVYLLLSILDGAPKGFATTLITLSYASAPAIIPYLIGWIWSLIVQVIGLSESHQSSIWKPTLAVTIPFLILFFLILAGLSVLFASHLFNIPGFKP